MASWKVITVWQPYANLLAWGEKRYETRSWQPGEQLKPGEIVMIHAAVRKPTQYEQRLFSGVVFREAFERHHIATLDDLPYGADRCRRAAHSRHRNRSENQAGQVAGAVHYARLA